MAKEAGFSIPPVERILPTMTADPWRQISGDFLQLEGLCFDRHGSLHFVEVFGGTIFIMDMTSGELRTIETAAGLMPTAIKIHKDGRLFACCVGNFTDGRILSMAPDGSNPNVEVEGYTVDDMVFDSTGGFYFTDFVGEALRPTGGVYYAPADGGEIKTVMPNMAGPNGVALSVDERRLWVTETNANRLHLVELSADRVSAEPYGTCIPYRFTGHLGPDSCCIDAAGNLYVAMYEQGRVLIFNPSGVPVAQVLVPGREQGHMLRTTHPVLIPGTDELIICANDHDRGGGAWLFRAKGLAKAHLGYQFQ